MIATRAWRKLVSTDGLDTREGVLGCISSDAGVGVCHGGFTPTTRGSSAYRWGSTDSCSERPLATADIDFFFARYRLALMQIAPTTKNQRKKSTPNAIQSVPVTRGDSQKAMYMPGVAICPHCNAKPSPSAASPKENTKSTLTTPIHSIMSSTILSATCNFTSNCLASKNMLQTRQGRGEIFTMKITHPSTPFR